ncbi:MAG: hypothetical protein ABIN36_10840 [Ferruginibacter sp.]
MQGFNFLIKSTGTISSHFLSRNIFDFATAIHFIKLLPYGRNADKIDLRKLFTDNCGTCSTKHALLKQLAAENGAHELKLILVLFNMNGVNTPVVKPILLKNKLDYIPEAHNYLLAGTEYIDWTTAHSSKNNIVNDVISETEIETSQIDEFKVKFHKEYLQQWLKQNDSIKLSLDELWKIREECIEALSATGIAHSNKISHIRNERKLKNSST